MSKNHTQPDDEEEYTVVPVIPVDEIIHTDACPFCGEMDCPCHEDPDAIEQLSQYHQDGLVSTDEADRIYRGKPW